MGVTHFSVSSLWVFPSAQNFSIEAEKAQGIISVMTERDMQKAALRGEPSYVWRAGQQRRVDMIVKAAGNRVDGLVLENGCGVGMYVEKLTALG